MNKLQIECYIVKRIEELKLEKSTYMENFERSAKHYQIEEANKCYRWYRGVCERIDELEAIMEKIGGDE